MRNFKIGDKVTATINIHPHRGTPGTIINIYTNYYQSGCACITVDYGNERQSFHEAHLRLVGNCPEYLK